MQADAVVVATGPVTESTHRILESVARVVVAAGDEDTLIALAGQADGFIVRGDSRLSGAVIAAATRLKVIGRSGIGVDNVDVDAATNRGIPIVVTPNAGVDAIAEGTFAMLLALAKQLRDLDEMVRCGRWSDRDLIEPVDLNEATLGIMGIGRIGRRVAELGTAFGMHILATDPAIEDDKIRQAGIEPVSLQELFARSDHITLHAPLQAETQGVVTAELLQSAGPGAFLVNLARGGLIESLDALAAALDSGALGGVGLDVFEPEPPDILHPFFSDSRVLLSPHSLGLTTRSRRRVFEDMARGILAVLEGRRPEAVANPDIFKRQMGAGNSVASP